MRPNGSYRRDMRPGGLPRRRPLQSARGETSVLRDRRDAVLGDRADALGGGDADLGDFLDAVGDAGELLGHDVRATRGVALDGVAVAADDALEAGGGPLFLAPRLGGGGGGAGRATPPPPLWLPGGPPSGAPRGGGPAPGGPRAG